MAGKTQTQAPTPRSLPWAMLLRRVFAIDVLECPDCKSPMKILAIVPGSKAEELLPILQVGQVVVEPVATGPPGRLSA